MHDIYLWLVWLRGQLEKLDANPAHIYAEHRGAFNLASKVFGAEKAKAFDGKKYEGGTRQKMAFDNVKAALWYFNTTRLQSSSRVKACRLVGEAIRALEAASEDIPF